MMVQDVEMHCVHRQCALNQTELRLGVTHEFCV